MKWRSVDVAVIFSLLLLIIVMLVNEISTSREVRQQRLLERRREVYWDDLKTRPHHERDAELRLLYERNWDLIAREGGPRMLPMSQPTTQSTQPTTAPDHGYKYKELDRR